jgi:phosphoribosylglycinamide formyltransferase-1
MKCINLAIFASGSGSNAQNIINYFADNKYINANLIFCNNPDAYVLRRTFAVPVEKIIFTKDEMNNGKKLEHELKLHNINVIVLAGFLLKIPEKITNLFQGAILNIHPALLPEFGGKGMFGSNVHKAVIDAGRQESGITIHIVDEHYDNGQIVFQAKCPVDIGDTPEMLASKIHELEQMHFPKVIEDYITSKFL